VKSAVLHGGGLVHKKRDAITSVQDFVDVVDHDSVNLQELELDTKRVLERKDVFF
jgi:hypothetical protein